MRWSAFLLTVLALAVAASAQAAEPSVPGPRALVPSKLPPAPATTPRPPAATPAPKAAPVAQTLRVGVEGAYPPFSEMTPEGKIKGFDIDIANALCEQINAKCTLIQDTFDALPGDLETGRTDFVVASLSMTAERREHYAFTNKYYQVPAKFVAKKGTDQRFDAASLRGVKVGVEDNTVFASLLTDRYGGIVQITRYPTLPDALAALAAGQVTLVMGDALAIDLDFLKAPEGQDYAFVGPDLVDPDWMGEGIGIAVRKNDTALRDRLDKAIAQLRASGRYQAIAQRYFDFDIYGGDVLPSSVRKPAGGGPRPLVRPPRDLPRLIDGTTMNNR